MTFRRWKRSSRKLPSAISLARSLFVAAKTRTFTLMALSEPTRVISDSCRARSTLVCAARLISPISSRKSVPPSACSNLPARSLTAPVNEPFMCPKSSDSISSEGIAAQLTSTIGPFARAECSWIRCATTSLPVPLGPVMSTRASVGATLSIISRTRWIAADSPIICGPLLATFLRSCLVSCLRFLVSKAFFVVMSMRLRSSGFSRKSYAPILSACTAVSMSP